MAQIVSWITVLNEESQWQSRRAMGQRLSAILHNTSDFTDRDLDAFEETIARMRSIIDSLHFGGEPDLHWLDEQLADVKLRLSYESFLPQSLREVLPLLHAQAQGNKGGDLLKALAQTVLVQFADFVARALSDRQTQSIARCEGLFKGSDHSHISIVRSITDESERKWREEIDLLKQNQMIDTAAVQRCADIFIAGPKARFCSDACRFTTFQLAKQLKDPRYHADKQKKYRNKFADTD